MSSNNNKESSSRRSTSSTSQFNKLRQSQASSKQIIADNKSHETAKNGKFSRLNSRTNNNARGKRSEKANANSKPEAIITESNRSTTKKPKKLEEVVKDDDKELATTKANDQLSLKTSMIDNLEQETNLTENEQITSPLLEQADRSSSASTPTPSGHSKDIFIPAGWEQHRDENGPYFWHVSSGIIRRNLPSEDQPLLSKKSSLVLYHDDEEINQATPRTSSIDEDEDDFYESGAALTVAEDTVSEFTFVVYPLGCCDFDETQLHIPANSTRAIQKCILRLSNQPSTEESLVWGLDPSRPVLMKLLNDYIQFTDLNNHTLLRTQPIPSIRTWAVDDDNNFAFVIEERPQQAKQFDQSCSAISMEKFDDSSESALLNEPMFVCYVFRSMDDDDMSCKVASKLNHEITRYKEQLSHRLHKSTRIQQMVVSSPLVSIVNDDDQTDADGDDLEELEASHEMTMNVKYIGKTQVHRPVGIDVLNVAIDKCLSQAIAKSSSHENIYNTDDPFRQNSALIEAKIHVSPSSVIVENTQTGEIIVECRIRYLTFIGISRRDIRWCGFIMQNITNKSFIAHCFECHPTAGQVCEAIQMSCMKMYEKVVKTNQIRHQPETLGIIPSGSKIRNTLVKTLSRIKLNPIT